MVVPLTGNQRWETTDMEAADHRMETTGMETTDHHTETTAARRALNAHNVLLTEMIASNLLTGPSDRSTARSITTAHSGG